MSSKLWVQSGFGSKARVAFTILLLLGLPLLCEAQGTKRLGLLRTRHAATAAAPATYQQPNMTYNGGALLPRTTTYAFWWGDLSQFPVDAVQGIDTMLEGLDASHYLQIAQQYMAGGVVPHTRFGGHVFDGSTAPTMDPAVNDTELAAEVCKVAADNHITLDPSVVVMVYAPHLPTDPLGYCAFHGYQSCPSGATFHYAYLPNASGLPDYCDLDSSPPFISPNHHSAGTRSLALVTGHEFMETITDPNFDGWYDPVYGNEIGDPCAWTYVDRVPLTNSTWTLQSIWSNAIHGCAQGSDRPSRVVGATRIGNTDSVVDVSAAAYGTFLGGLNTLGQSVGFVLDANNIDHGVVAPLFEPARTLDLPDALYGTVLRNINDQGMIAGQYWGQDFADVHGFVIDVKGHVTVFDAVAGLPGTSVHALSENGQVTGIFMDSVGTNHGYYRDRSGRSVAFDAPGANLTAGTVPFAINDSGAIAGAVSDTQYRVHGFIRDVSGLFTVFDAPLAVQGTYAYGINSDGDVVGYFTDAGSLNRGFVRHSNGRFEVFDAPGAAFGTLATGINDDGAVTGAYSDAHGETHGFIRDAEGHFAVIEAAGLSINAHGDVSGYQWRH